MHSLSAIVKWMHDRIMVGNLLDPAKLANHLVQEVEQREVKLTLYTAERQYEIVATQNG